MRKIVSLLLILSILLTLPACGQKPVPSAGETEGSRPTIPMETQATQQRTEETFAAVPTETTEPAPTEPPATRPVIQTETIPTQPPAEETQPADQPTEPPIPPQVETPVPTYGHVALSKTAYYQYSVLTTGEKQLYNKIVTGIENLQSEIPVTGVSIQAEDGLHLFYKVLADHPEFFWVSRKASVTYNPRTMVVQSFIVLYTDGEKSDITDSNNKPVALADRAKIAAKRTALKEKISQILSIIPANIPEIDREKQIYDYIVTNVQYDSVAAAQPDPVDSILPHAYDVYGAAVEGKAVCEGYSKLFQHLCYQTGINATQISGTADGGGHMWNAVNLDGDWYETDVTWGDGGNDLVYYEHFNLTHDQMAKDHIADGSVVPYPACNGTKYSYGEYYALKALANGQVSDNYKLVVDSLISVGSGYLILYKNGLPLTADSYNAFVYNKTAAINQYAFQRGYRLEFANTFITYGEYVYFSYTAKQR